MCLLEKWGKWRSNIWRKNDRITHKHITARWPGLILPCLRFVLKVTLLSVFQRCVFRIQLPGPGNRPISGPIMEKVGAHSWLRQQERCCCWETVPDLEWKVCGNESILSWWINKETFAGGLFSLQHCTVYPRSMRTPCPAPPAPSLSPCHGGQKAKG